jgi:hypothetical protein
MKVKTVDRRPNSCKPPFTGRLLKRIDLVEAKPRDLRAALALPPLAVGENNPQRLAKALIEREFGIQQNSSN